MATSWKWWKEVVVLFVVVFSTRQVVGYYCDSDKCGVDEYCCGVNICCTSYAVWQMWYFWCGIIFFLVLLCACAGFCRYRYYQTAIIIQGSTPYSRFDNSAISKHRNAQMPGEFCEYPGMAYPTATPPKYIPDYPPPPYNQTTAPLEKDRDHFR